MLALPQAHELYFDKHFKWSATFLSKSLNRVRNDQFLFNFLRHSDLFLRAPTELVVIFLPSLSFLWKSFDVWLKLLGCLNLV